MTSQQIDFVEAYEEKKAIFIYGNKDENLIVN